MSPPTAMTGDDGGRVARTPRTAATVSLQEAADLLGVHYMTAYRYVRIGRLRATRREGRWHVPASEIARLKRKHPKPSRRRQSASAGRGAARQLGARLVAGDEPGAWAILEGTVISGRSPVRVLTEVLAPALTLVGEWWATGRCAIADEHRATVVAGRLLGRLGPMLARRGRTRGKVLLACVPGELHAMPAALLAAVLRNHGYDVVELGADTPTDEIVSTARQHPDLMAVGLSASTPDARRTAADVVAQVRAEVGGAFILVGGVGIETEDRAVTAGADDWAADADGVVAILEARRQASRKNVGPRADAEGQ